MSKFSTGKSSTFNFNHVFQTSVILGNVQVLKSVMKSQVGNIYLDRFIKNEDTEIGIFIEIRVSRSSSARSGSCAHVEVLIRAVAYLTSTHKYESLQVNKCITVRHSMPNSISNVYASMIIHVFNPCHSLAR